MPVKYQTEIDLTKSNTSHALMVELIGRDQRVLDMGCASGHLAKVLRDRGCVVAGVEIDREAADLARPFLDQLVVGNLEELRLTDLFPPASFDVIVFGDVLEHLRDPLAALRQCHPLLAPGGRVVASVPNVAHGSVRLALLQGQFRYRPLGLLDETHLRFFTRGSLHAVFREAGFVPIDERGTRAGIFETEVDVDAGKVPEGVVEQLRQDPDSETYQFVLTAVPQDEHGLLVELYERDREQQQELFRLRRELATLTEGRDRQVTSVRIGIWGRFDRDDLWAGLALAVTRGELMRRLPGASVRVFAPTGANPAGLGMVEPVELLMPWSSERATELAEQLDAIVVAGPLGPAGPPMEALVTALSGLDPSRCPCLFSAVQLDSSEAGPGDEVLRMVAGSPYSTVSGPCRAAIAGPAELFVADPLLLLHRQFGSGVLPARRAYLQVMGWYPEGPAIVIQDDASLLPHHRSIAEALDRLATAEGGHVVIIEPNGPTGGPSFASALATQLTAPAWVVPVDAGSESLVAAIACGEIILASSPHVLTLAVAFKRRSVGLQLHGQPLLEDFARLTGRRDDVVRAPSELVDVARRTAATDIDPDAIVELERGVDAHFDRMAEALLRHWHDNRRAAPSAPAGPSGASTSSGLIAQLGAVTAAHQALQRRLVAERTAFAERAARLRDRSDGAGLSLFSSIGREAEARALEAQLEEARQELDALNGTRTLRMLRPIRRFYARLRGRNL